MLHLQKLPPNIGNVLEILNNKKLLDSETKKLITIHHSFDLIAQAIYILNDTGHLTETNIKWINKHSDPEKMAKALIILHEDQFLTETSIKWINEYYNPEEMAGYFSIINSSGHLTETNIKWINKHSDPEKMAKALIMLNEELLKEENIKWIKEHSNPEKMAEALNILDDAKLLKEENIKWVNKHSDPEKMAKALIMLNEELLKEENIKWINEHSDPEKMAEALNILDDARLLKEENIKWVNEHSDPEKMAEALNILDDAKLLKEENIKWINEHSDPEKMAEALNILDDAKLLKEENIKWVNKHSDPEKIAKALIMLGDAQLLNEKNIKLITEVDIDNIVSILSIFNRVNLLNQENFDQFFNSNYQIFSSMYLILYQIPDYLFTQNVFNELIRYLRDPNAREEILTYVERLIRQNENQHPINPDQSTHTASIHQSASASASKLYERYGKEISDDKLDLIILDIQQFISSLPDDSEIYLAAKRCIERITQPNYLYKEPTSQITIRQLLALTYLALKDSDLCTALDDALQLFIEGLYEIQRGYNLSENNIDDYQKRDKSICIAGAFNKLLEKVNGSHPDVELVFITLEIASLKLPKVVLEETYKYLQKQSSPKFYSDFQKFVRLIETLKNEGVEVIWSEIEPKINKRLLVEFGVLFRDKNYPDFKKFIDSGKYTELDDLSRYQKNLVNSLGYQQYCSHMIKNSPRFFQNKADRTEHETGNPHKNYTEYGYRD